MTINNSIFRKYAKNKILKNRENKKTKPKTEEWFKQKQHTFRDLPQATATHDQIPWKIYMELTTYHNILTEFLALVEVDVKH
jgi:hypothetical protein